ncbi:ABC transporter permease [Paracoccus suum]|nr:iron ABC transporter permease [Paracoccus suum]
MKARQKQTAAGALLSLVVAALLVIFIAVPFAAVLRESVVVSQPMSLQRLDRITREAIAEIPDAERDVALARWAGQITPSERVEAMAAAFHLADRDVPWDRSRPYEEQDRRAQAAHAALDPVARSEVDDFFAVAHVMLHKRTALAFMVREEIGKARFDGMRSGVERQFGLANYAEVLATPHFQRAAINSLTLASVTTLMTVSLAFALAYGLNSGALPRPGLMRGVLLLPLVAPPVLIATATLMLFGRRGLITNGLLDGALGLVDADQVNIYGPVGIVVVQMLAFLPAALIVLDNGFRDSDPRLVEAAPGLGAGYGAQMRSVVLPMSFPALKRTIVLVFIMALTDFSNPMLLGGGFPVLAEVIYDQITAYRNMPLAAAVCIILLIPPLLLYVALEQIGRRRRFFVPGAAPRGVLPVPAPARRLLAGLALAAGGAILLVYGTMILGAFTRIWGVDRGLTLGYFIPALQPTGLPTNVAGMSEVADSLRLALVAAPLGGLLAVLVAYVVERLRPPGSGVIFFITLMPAILPGIIFGIGYILAFNAPFGIPALSLSGTFAILVLNVMFGNLFVGVLAGRAALQRLDRSVDEAAEGLGAGIGAQIGLIMLPLLRVPILLGTLYVFIDALTTLSSVIFLVSGDHKLASIAIFNAANGSSFGPAAAKSVALLVIALTAMALLRRMERRAGTGFRKEVVQA